MVTKTRFSQPFTSPHPEFYPARLETQYVLPVGIGQKTVGTILTGYSRCQPDIADGAKCDADFSGERLRGPAKNTTKKYASTIRSPRYVPPKQDFWKVYEVASLPVRGIAGKQDRFMLLTMSHSAGRRKEIFRIAREDLNFSTNMIRLWTRKRRGRNLEADWIPMTSILRKGLLEWIEIRPIKDTENLFVCLDGALCNEDYYGKRFSSRQHIMRSLCKAAKVKTFGFHSIPHLTASILFVAGESLWKIQGILRHKNPTTTERYLRTMGLESARDAMENNLRGPDTPFPKKVTPPELGL
jgi:integrase